MGWGEVLAAPKPLPYKPPIPYQTPTQHPPNTLTAVFEGIHRVFGGCLVKY